jgi:leucyl-tRNA synthetase
LQDAGDAVEDANFVFSMAEAGVLRLFNFVDWVKEMIKARTANELRKSTDLNFADRVFANDINKAIRDTAGHYERTFFKEAVRTGFFEFQVILSCLVCK